MYSKEFWNNIYKNHFDDAPWMIDSWKGIVVRLIEQYLPTTAESLLDYGCGNGFMGYYFYHKGLNVDLSDISNVLIEKLVVKYKDTPINIIQADSPHQLTTKKYDAIIAWSLFHHINPNDWDYFLDGFRTLLNENGIMAIGGWDNSDEIIKIDGNTARYTGGKTWCINSLYDHVTNFSILKNDTLTFAVPPFTINRVQRYYILKK